ncbi:MAG: CotH kinase family protein [Saprospiraceae bacterium]|nr:CotH kinase family protein [Saprospiraceae bacterium]MCF8251074.1 CotH kinase family protein [Saprospiraceae bacterium]MCF8280359.1 CotH kinase family protein [Bacteroidales bacterium]MCF8312870.1 CotH kinase family protein [Saprospiraceae bacterium]MCF8441333.1 CotH kinase family protein [Saprospiraceae bacterium]
MNKHLLRPLLLFAGLAVYQIAFSQSIFINEFVASNSNGATDEAGQHEDWVELFNAGLTAVDIGSMHLTDDLGQPTKWKVPATNPAMTTIQPGGYLLFWLDGEPAQSVLHANFKLGAGGEDLGLYAADGSQLDALTFGPQTANVSYGRSADGSSSFQFFTTPTPLASNGGTPGGSFAQAPTVSVGGGFFSSAFALALSSATPGAQIRYTLDGSEPDGSAQFYSNPIQIAQNSTLRARTFATGYLPSPITTHSYLFDTPHDFPVVALSFKDTDFFDTLTGIYPNYTEDWKSPVHVAFFETDGMPGFSQDATAEVSGTGSAQFPQKSLKIKALANNGSGFFQHPIFPELPFEEYKNLLLRNGGQDWNVTMFRDAFVASLVSDLTDLGSIIEPPKLYLQAFRPGVAYLNGQYWGIHNLREHIKTDYIEQHFGLTETEIDLLENDGEAVAGDFDRWNDFTEFFNTHNFVNPTHYEQLAQRLDLDHFLDYNAFNIIIDNSDWPGNNLRRWRERNGSDARWRFLSFDFDFSFGLVKIEGSNILFNTGDASANSLARALDDSSIAWPNPWWTTLPFRKAMESTDFRRNFINRSADFLNVLFATDRVSSRIDDFETLYAPEMQRHFDRWSSGWNPWADNLLILRKFGNDRPAFVRQQYVDFFDEIGGEVSVQLAAQPTNGGGIHFSTLHLPADKLPWIGTYFTGVEIPVEADAAPGFVFEKWSNSALGASSATSTTLTANESLTAIFKKGSIATDTIVINEINYHSPDGGDWVELYNPNTHAVDVSGWVLEDESGSYFNLHANTTLQPGGFLVLVENEAAFTSFYPQTTNWLGSFGIGSHGFKLSNGGERISLKNANLTVIDSVRYDNKLPWPPDADGTGLSLQLIDWRLNNALPTSWQAQLPTPGLSNQVAAKQQTIDFQPIGDQFTIALPIILHATATSGLPVKFTVTSGPAIINGDILTVTGLTGPVIVRASQQGNTDWQPAVPVLRSFNVLEFQLPDSGGPVAPVVVPNPVGPTIGVRFSNNEDGLVRLSVSAVNGVEMLRKNFDLPAGTHFTQMEAVNLPKGYYFLSINATGQRQQVVAFVKG